MIEDKIREMENMIIRNSIKMEKLATENKEMLIRLFELKPIVVSETDKQRYDRELASDRWKAYSKYEEITTRSNKKIV